MHIYEAMFIVYENDWFWQPIDDSRTLGEVGFTSSTAKAQTPATVGLVFRQDGTSTSFFVYEIFKYFCNNCQV